MRRFRPGLRRQGVTEQQWRILRALAHLGPLEVTALADATCLLAPSLSRILPAMESRELVCRRQLNTDLRRAVVSLKPKGLKLIAAHAPDSESVYNAIAFGFGAQRLSQLFTLLRKLEQTLDLQQIDDHADPLKARLSGKGQRNLRMEVRRSRLRIKDS